MRYCSLIFIFFAIFFSACGKPPLLNKEKGKSLYTGDIYQTETQGRAFELRWVISPDLSLMGEFNVKFDLALGNSEEVRSYIYMPDMGHGSSPITILKMNAQEFSFSEVAFIMPGLWTLHLEIYENNQRIDQWQTVIIL